VAEDPQAANLRLPLSITSRPPAKKSRLLSEVMIDGYIAVATMCAMHERPGSPTHPINLSKFLTRAFRCGSDVGLNPLTPITGEWIGSVFTPVDNLTPEQKALIEVSDACVAEMEAADVIVLGVATYNFNISASLKLWIDYIARQGKTFQYGANGPEG